MFSYNRSTVISETMCSLSFCYIMDCLISACLHPALTIFFMNAPQYVDRIEVTHGLL